MDKKVVVKRKLNVKGLIVILLTLYLLIMVIYYFFTMPLKNIDIIGNNVLTDEQIIKQVNLEKNTSLFLINTYLTEKKIKELPITKNVKV